MSEKQDGGEFWKQDDMTKFALDDARTRLKSETDLMLAIDRQAMSLFGYSVGIAIAAGSGASAMLVNSASWGSRYLPLVMALVVVSLGFIFVAGCCLHVMRSERIGLAGRKPNFWLAALKSVSPEDRQNVAESYLEHLIETYSATEMHCRSMARGLSVARTVAIAATIAGVVVSAAAPLLNL